jgi:hypothetical protein
MLALAIPGVTVPGSDVLVLFSMNPPFGGANALNNPCVREFIHSHGIFLIFHGPVPSPAQFRYDGMVPTAGSMYLLEL